MAQVFNYDKIQKPNLKVNQWVRIKSGIYEGDLAHVVLIEDPITKIVIKLMPRISETQKKKKMSLK